MGRLKDWWEGLGLHAQDWFVIGGFLMLAVVGIVAGCFGVAHILILEPMAHIGFTFGIVGFMGALFYGLAQI